jgi:hypothetical protein
MAPDLLEALKQLELNTLSPLVRQDLRSPHCEIERWRAAPLSQQGIINPGGLFVIRGDGRDDQGHRIMDRLS